MALLSLVLLSAALRPAVAACVVSQTQAPDGVEFTIAVDGTCPTVSIISDRPGVLQVWQEEDGFRHKLPKGQLVEHPWATPALGWRIAAPLLGAGDSLVVRLVWTSMNPPVPHIDVRLDGSAPVLARGGTAVSTWTFVGPKHPEWGFTDPRWGRLERTTQWTFGADGEAGWLDGPLADGGGGWWAGGPGSASTAFVEAPAPALGEVQLPPGKLTFWFPGELVNSGSPAVTTVKVGQAGEVGGDAEQGWSVAAPAGGRFRWRVASVDGVAVIADDVGFVAGTDYHFRVASLNEPSLPMSLRGDRDMNRVLPALWAAVRLPPTGQAGDVGHPRPLNRAWRSGWLTDGERALVLLRFLGQEHIAARWVLTGADADPVTLVGYDHLLLAAQLPASDQVIWLDPACATCALGEIDPDLSGRVALGGADRAPLLSGTLSVTALLVQSEAGLPTVHTTVIATGNGARWLRARVHGEVWPVVPPARLDDVARIFGAIGAASVRVSGWPGEAITIDFESTTAPRPVNLPQFAG